MDIRKRLLGRRRESRAASSGRKLRFDSGAEAFPRPHIPPQPGGWFKPGDAPGPSDEDDTDRHAA